MPRAVALPPIAGLCALLAGCYYAKQAEGQLRILAGLRDIPAMVDDPSVPDATREKLRLVLEIREFGERRMGLAPSTNYTRFFDTQGRPVSWIVSACRKDRFEPYTWWFPIVGALPYKGFFRRGDAEAESRAIEGEGYDILVSPVSAYSTLGWFSDPVFSPMLDLPEGELAALILHELTHGTVFVSGAADFNESLATFTGQQGALEFIRWRYGTRSDEYDRAVRAFGLAERRDERARELFRKLDEFYRSAASPARKVELRDSIAGRPVNNAEILMQRRYGRLEEFRDLFEQAGGDWRGFFERVRPGRIR